LICLTIVIPAKAGIQIKFNNLTHPPAADPPRLAGRANPFAKGEQSAFPQNGEVAQRVRLTDKIKQ
jgi:hypothetical protein